MTSICLTLEFLKFKIVKSKKQATKKPQSYYHKKHTTFTKKKTTSYFNFQFTVTNIMTKSKQFFTYLVYFFISNNFSFPILVKIRCGLLFSKVWFTICHCRISQYKLKMKIGCSLLLSQM